MFQFFVMAFAPDLRRGIGGASVFIGGRGRACRIFRRRSLRGLCGAPLVAMPDGHDDPYHDDGYRANHQGRAARISPLGGRS